MLQSEHMPDLVQRDPVQLNFTQRLSRVERNPAIKIKPLGQLRPCCDGGGLEKLSLSIDKLDRAVLSVVFMRVHVENTGPCIHRKPKLSRQYLLRRRHPPPEIHMPLI